MQSWPAALLVQRRRGTTFKALRIAAAAWPVLALAAGQALAQQPPPETCMAISDEGLPPALAGWANRSPVTAAADVSGVGAAQLPVGRSIAAKLRPTRDVVFPVLPAQPGGSVSHSGLFELPITEAGDYQISLGGGAWIDVVSGESSIQSSRHGPGPACSSVRKTVTFPLQPGRYVVTITGAGDPELVLMASHAAP